MTTQRDDDVAATFASPPCLLHEVDPAYSGLATTASPKDWSEVQRWREGERARLLAARLAIPPPVRRAKDVAIAANLEAILGDVGGRVVSAYHAIDGEPELDQLLGRLVAAGARTALPVVVAPGRPLLFRAWTPGERLERGIRGILVIGSPNKPLLEVPVGIDKAGIVIIGGLNPVACWKRAALPR